MSESGLCGAATTASEVEAPEVTATSGSASERTFVIGVATPQGTYTVCYCPTHSSCDGPEDFTHTAGTLTVRGPTGGEDDTCIAGVTCTAGPFTGESLSPRALSVVSMKTRIQRP